MKGDSIRAKVMDVGLTEINYFRFDNKEGPTYTILKSDVFMIRYENGTKDIFSNEETADSNKISNLTISASTDNCLKGKVDAHLFHGRESGNFFSGFLFGPFGVIGAALSSPKPKTTTFVMSKNKDLFKDTFYLSCYKRKARGMNVFYSSLGWASWIFVYIIFHK